MPPASRAFSTLLSARSTLLAGCRKSSFREGGFSSAANRSPARFSTIAEAMLGRAVKDYIPVVKERTGSAVHSSSPPNVDDLLKTRLPPVQQSIGAFASASKKTHTYTGGAMGQVSRRSGDGTTPSAASRPSYLNASRKRSSAEMSTGVEHALQSSGTFENSANTIDLTQDEPSLPSHVVSTNVAQFGEFDLNDFDDDSDIDLDLDYPTGLPPSSTRKPLHTVSSNVATAGPVAATQTPKLRLPASSTMTWSSSPLAHKITPPGVIRSVAPPTTTVVVEPESSDIRPPAPKRRTMPWLSKPQAEVENDVSEAAVEDLGSVPDLIAQPSSGCYKCGREGHFAQQCDVKSKPCANCGINGYHHVRGCPRAPRTSSDGLRGTPIVKRENSHLWTTTASAVKARTQALKDKNKELRENNRPHLTEAEQRQVIAAETISTKKGKPKQHAFLLTTEQRSVASLVVDKSKSVFFTGSAGTGKSVLMRAIIADLKKKYRKEPERVAVTASTGLAACNIGGTTLHSFSGIGLGKEPVSELVKKIIRNAKAKQRWLKTKVLVVDEISMIDGDMFDKLEEIARRLRKNGRPFGGIQLVITGDFFQLPPVPDYGKVAKFAFDANTWATAIDHTIGLTQVFRQRDPEFANMLNQMRLGQVTDETIAMFKKLDRPLVVDGPVEATELFPTRNEVDNANAFKMRSLVGKSYVFKAQDSGTIHDEKARDKLLANCMAPQMLELKKGSQVMLIKNMDETLVNGSLGTVLAFWDEKKWTEYTAGNEPRPDANEHGDEDAGSAKGDTGLNKFQSKMNTHLIGGTAKLYPFVAFQLADGTYREMLVMEEDWKIELPNGEIQAQRMQLPLILAWALSIHKAQGQTLEHVTVDLKKIFENGQAYVALSRATTQEGLQVKNFNKKAVMAHPKVAGFYNSLYDVNKALKYPKVAPAKVAMPLESDDVPSDADLNVVMRHQSVPARDPGRWEYDDDEEAAIMAAGH